MARESSRPISHPHSFPNKDVRLHPLRPPELAVHVQWKFAKAGSAVLTHGAMCGCRRSCSGAGVAAELSLRFDVI